MVLTLCIIAGGLSSVIAAAMVFVAAVRSGQMDDLEETKFQMLREDHDR